MLFRQHLRRRDEHRLFAGADGLHHSRHRDHGFAGADLALQQALHQAKMPGSDPEEPGGLSLALKLDFHESTQSKNYKIEKYEGTTDEYITLGDDTVPTTIYNDKREGTAGNPVPSDQGFANADRGSSVITIDFPDEPDAEGKVVGKDQYYYFSNLPKYDTTGTIVRYTVEEGLKSEDGKFISFEDYIAQAEPGDALAKELGGQLSGEHGIGNGRLEFLEEFVGPRMIQLYKAIKLAFDDRLILNPGKVIEFREN